MPGRYARDTSVSTDKSQAEIKATLQRYGASGFLFGHDENRAVVGFKMADRQVRFYLTLPSPAEERFTHTARRGLRRRPEDSHREWEQACRQQWRALALVIKAKLEAVAAGIAVFESEFLANIVLPDGRLVGEHVAPAISRAYATNKMQQLLPHFGE